MSERRARVVVGIDGTPGADRALAWARQHACNESRPLHLVHAHPVLLVEPGAVGLTPFSARQAEVWRARAVRLLADTAASASAAAPDLVVTTELVSGSAGGALVAASTGAHVVVVGDRGLGPLCSLVGSVSAQTAEHAHAPVVVVRDGGADRPRDGVVVGVDATPGSQACLAFAFEHAAALGTGLDVVHAWPWDGGPSAPMTPLWEPDAQVESVHRRVLDDALAGWSHKYPQVAVTPSLVRDHAVPALLEHADGARLLVVGRRGRGGFAGLLLGSVGRDVLHRATCPVAVVSRVGG
jgi:nucleotide-binding universal stress UspA family protein